MRPESLVAFDTETHLIQPGLLAPPMVCGSVADQHGAQLLDKDSCRLRFAGMLVEGVVIVGANIPYDFLVMLQDAASRGEDVLAMLRSIFSKYERGEVFDVQVAEALHAIKGGHLGLMPDRGPLKDPGTGKVTNRYSLAMVTRLTLGRCDAKDHDRWRLSYATLEGNALEDWPADARQYPVDDAVNTRESAMAQVHSRGNLHDLAAQCFAAWAMHLGAAWGFKVDLEELARVKAKATEVQEAGRQGFVVRGILREDGKKNTPYIKHLVAKAYGATKLCPQCKGTQKAISAKTGKEVNCGVCGSSGYDLEGTKVPRTDKGGVGAGRDALLESGHENLMSYARYSEQDKVLTTYVPWLEKGIKGPINLRPNPLLANGRASYSDVVQLLPRNMGVRECIVARDGYVFCSCDYSSLELVTHAQSCLWLLPGVDIRLATAINAGVKVHDLLGSQMMGIDYFDFLQRRKDGNKEANNIRQAAKAANFGFPGGMGAVTLVLAKRKEDFHTGGFKGIRFCMLMGGEDSCGTTMVTEFKGREYPPVCVRCVECAVELREQWFDAWPENRDYFKFISKQVDTGYIVQHVSKRVRGGVGFCDAANGYFSGLAADGAKRALCNVAKEQYCDPASPLYGSRTILFAHDEILAELPKHKAHEAATRLSEVMVASMREYTPDVAVEAEPCLMERWYKGAEPVYVEGRLVPWRPE